MRPMRLTVPDARGQGATLRVSRHPDQRKVVLSHWRDGVCVASTPIEVSEVPGLIGVLADALGDALEVDHEPNLVQRGFLSALRHWLRPRLAQVSEFRLPREGNEERSAS